MPPRRRPDFPTGRPPPHPARAPHPAPAPLRLPPMPRIRPPACVDPTGGEEIRALGRKSRQNVDCQHALGAVGNQPCGAGEYALPREHALQRAKGRLKKGFQTASDVYAGCVAQPRTRFWYPAQSRPRASPGRHTLPHAPLLRCRRNAGFLLFHYKSR